MDYSFPASVYPAVAVIADTVNEVNRRTEGSSFFWFEGLLYSGDEIVGTTYTEESAGDFEFVTGYQDKVIDSSDHRIDGYHGGRVMHSSIMRMVPSIVNAVNEANQIILADGNYSLTDLRTVIRLVGDGDILLGTTEGELEGFFTIID